MYKAQDQEEYKTTTIRIRKTHYDVLKYDATKDIELDFDIFK